LCGCLAAQNFQAAERRQLSRLNEGSPQTSAWSMRPPNGVLIVRDSLPVGTVAPPTVLAEGLFAYRLRQRYLRCTTLESLIGAMPHYGFGHSE
jgi:hypothetical protein